MENIKKALDDTMFTGLSFDQALNLMTQGHKVKRKCWGNEYLYMKSTNVLSMADGAHFNTIIHVGTAHSFWAPKQDDITATDWEVVE